MLSLPYYIPAIFVLTTFATAALFYKSTNGSRTTLLLLTAWSVLLSLIALTGFYTHTGTVPPRQLLLVVPPLLCIIILFATRDGRAYIDSLDPRMLAFLHTVRIPVELVLYWLFLHKAVPQVMTFEGRNVDIISGLTAPAVFYFGYVRKVLSPKVILLWNFSCLALLFNIVGTAILAAPSAFQQLAFDQPNIAVLYFPFVLLPGLVVPLVLLSHLAAIRQLVVKSWSTKKINAEVLSSPLTAGNK